jgi:hypothetical protein
MLTRIYLRKTSVSGGGLINTILGLLKNCIGNNIDRRATARYDPEVWLRTAGTA